MNRLVITEQYTAYQCIDLVDAKNTMREPGMRDPRSVLGLSVVAIGGLACR